jgi:hypothetical protein
VMKTTKYLKIPLMFLLTVFSVGVSSPALASKSRLEERLTRLFYWQMSQALDLSTIEEKQMSAVMDDVSRRRLQAIDKRDQVFAKMNGWLEANASTIKDLPKDKTPEEVKELLKEYRMQLDALSKIDLEEHEQLQKLLGDLRLLKFYNERKIIIERIKKALN